MLKLVKILKKYVILTKVKNMTTTFVDLIVTSSLRKLIGVYAIYAKINRESKMFQPSE